MRSRLSRLAPVAMTSVLDITGGGSFLNLFIVCGRRGDADGHHLRSVGESRVPNKRQPEQAGNERDHVYDLARNIDRKVPSYVY